MILCQIRRPLSGSEAVDVALLEEVQLAEQSINNDAVNVALRAPTRSRRPLPRMIW